jgi:hypothetical protein
MNPVTSTSQHVTMSSVANAGQISLLNEPEIAQNGNFDALFAAIDKLAEN